MCEFMCFLCCLKLVVPSILTEDPSHRTYLHGSTAYLAWERSKLAQVGQQVCLLSDNSDHVMGEFLFAYIDNDLRIEVNLMKQYCNLCWGYIVGQLEYKYYQPPLPFSFWGLWFCCPSLGTDPSISDFLCVYIYRAGLGHRVFKMSSS